MRATVASERGDGKNQEQVLTSPNEGLDELNERLRKRIEALETTEASFRVLAENVPAFFAYIDADERYVFANKAHEALFGLPSDRIEGMSLEELVGREAYELTRPHVARALAGDEVIDETEIPIRGRRRWVRVNLMPDRDEDGRVRGFFALAADFTREKRALQAVKESHDRLASVLETVMEAIVTIDKTGSIDGFNPAAERMFGYTADEVMGRNVSMLMPEPYHSEHDRYIERYLQTREARIIGKGREVTALRKDGSTFPIELAVSEIDHQERFNGIIRDITARKKTEAALELSREELRLLSARLLTAEESERRRISRELHDDINQRLAMLSIDLERCAASRSLDAEASALLKQLQENVSTLSDDVHAMAYRLHPAILDDLGLLPAVRALVNDFSTRHGIEVSVRERHFPARRSGWSSRRVSTVSFRRVS